MTTDKFDILARRADRSDPGPKGRHDAHRSRLDTLLRSLRGAPSRREVLRGLAATGFGIGLAASPQLGEGKPKRRKKRKRPKPAKPNQYGCLEVSDPCRNATQCCSGICAGKPGRKRCRGHHTGSCSQQGQGVCTDPNPELQQCITTNCFCLRTTAGSNFCGNWFGYKACSTCKRDTDCQALGFPVGSACVPVSRGHCTAAECASGMVCIAPCGVEPPPAM